MKTIVAVLIVSFTILACGQSGGNKALPPQNDAGNPGVPSIGDSTDSDTTDKTDTVAPLPERKEITPPEVTKPH